MVSKTSHKGLDPLCLPASCNLPAHDNPPTEAAVKPKVASPLFMLSSVFFSLLHVVCQLTSHLQLHKAFVTTFISLITCVCQLHICPFTQSLSLSLSLTRTHIHTHTHTHTHTVGLRFWGSYDTIQILLAAYSREMCFAQSHSPQKSRFSLPSSFDPHGTGGLCQQSCVSAEGPGGPQGVTHCSLSLLGQLNHYVALSPAVPSKIPMRHQTSAWQRNATMHTHRHTDTHTQNHTHNWFYGVSLEVRQIWAGP